MDHSSVGRVLLVDDRPEIRLLLRARLEVEGDLQIVGEASNGDEACQLTEILAPNLVVLDIEMPVMRGDEAIPRIREINPTVGIVVYTAGEYNLTGSSAADQVVPKGAPLGLLVTASHEILHRRSHDVLRLDLGELPLPMATDAFDAMAGSLTSLLDVADAGGDAVPGLVGTSTLEVRALLGIYAHLGYCLHRAAHAGDADLTLVVHAFRTQAAMARRALLALGPTRMSAILTDVQPSESVASTIATVNSRLLDALPKSAPGSAAAVGSLTHN